jgi:PPM family protein phosphatase
LAVPVRPASTIHLGARRVRVCTVECRAVIDAVTVEWGAASRVGCRRERNQDTFGARPPVFVVADGIGSHGAGDLASHLAVQALLALAARQPVTAEMFNRALADARARIAQNMRDPQAAADALVDTATRAGGSDDVTVVVVDAAMLVCSDGCPGSTSH